MNKTTYQVRLYDVWGLVSSAYRAKRETADKLVDQLIDKGTKTGKGFSEAWRIVVVEYHDNEKRIVRDIKFGG